MSLDLAALLDYESQIARDSLAAPEDLQAREKKIQKRLNLGSNDKKSALLAWLKELKTTEGPWPGEAIVRAYDAFVAAAFLLGLLSGIGMIQSLLRYDGSEPVNVIPFLAIYGVLQILLLLWYLGKALLARYANRLIRGALVSFLKDFALRYLHRRPQLFARAGLQEQALELFRRRLQDLHKRLLLNQAWKVFQVFGLGFHLASLFCFIAMISFNDYTFAWRTTLGWDASYFHTIVSVLAAPFAWMQEGLKPSFELVEASQFNRYQKDFLGSPGQGLGSVGWWPFLASVIACYGVLPRFLIWLQLKASARFYLKSWAFTDHLSETLWQRLQMKGAGWAHGQTEKLRAVPDQELVSASSLTSRNALLVLWRDVNLDKERLKDFLRESYRISVLESLDAKGLAKDKNEILDRLRKDSLLVVVSDPFELPGEAIDKIRLAVRERFGPLSILFAPIQDHDGTLRFRGDAKAWRHALQIYRDPYLGLLDESWS